ncbi:MAG: N-6 DNA methylase [Verrucomicrobia bacterium]|nr:N-6 DNA methylase [Verrucomicrobiota bacterium]
MAAESRPLFHPEVVRRQLRNFVLPASVADSRPRLQHWADLISSGQADQLKETDLLPDFLTDIFCTLLGYTRPAESPDCYTLSRETKVVVDGQQADAVLGRFRPDQREYLVALEGKGTRDPLEIPFGGRKMSAVDQCYRYAINLPCDWLIVTSMRETRLYHKGSNQQTYERFDTVRLAGDAGLLKRFVFLLGAARVVPDSGECHFKDLFNQSETVGREITRKFYTFYADLRQAVFARLRSENPAVLPQEILRCSQKLLDRILFCAFCEDRGLLPPETVRGAFGHRDPYNPKPIWDNFRGLFHSVDKGNSGLKIPAYNGGLFAHDEGLDTLRVPDDVCALFRDLAAHDFRPAREVVEADETREIRSVIDVEILGHIFEQSITDLERIRQDLESGSLPATDKDAKTRRKEEGAFYTPAFITRYIVEQTLGAVLAARFETLRQAEEAAAAATVRKLLADPNAYDPDTLTEPQRKALIRFWEAWQEVLKCLRILDPACGSGAFLIETFDQLHAVYEISNARLEELRGERTLFDPDRQILQHNLYGVDLNAEAIQICQLSLWIKTAAHGKALTSLDHCIREGNSVVSDPAVHPKAFDWQAAFPEVFAQGGFDVVVGNPPYVRQELLTPYKPWLAANYQCYHGMADLYVYFYELGLRVLKPGGLLSYIVTNKWMKAGYGEPLRRFFSEKSWIKSVVDFGHAKQIFEDADVFPCIIVAGKPTSDKKPKTARLCTIPREQLRIDDLSVQIEREGAEMEVGQLGVESWQLEPAEVTALLSKVRQTGKPLKDFAGVKPLRGIVTGCNEAFLIDSKTRDELVRVDPKSAEIVHPYLRGQDVNRWQSEWEKTWIIFTRRGIEIDAYPVVKAHLNQFRSQLEPKPDDWTGADWPGRKGGSYKWFEIQDSIDYWQQFDRPKISYQEIQFHPSYALDTQGLYGNNKTFFITSDDLYLLAVLNSPLMWWHNWRFLPHMKDEALSPLGRLMESLPIAEPTSAIREAAEAGVRRLIEITALQQQTHGTLLDWLRVEYAIEKPTTKLQNLTALDSDNFIAEVKHIRGRKLPLTAAGLQALREEYARTIEPARARAAAALNLECELSDLVNQAYGLTPAEIALLWATAPPRMPISKP